MGWFWFDDERLARIERKIDRILALAASTRIAVETEGVELMTLQDDVAKLTASVAAESTVADSAITWH